MRLGLIAAVGAGLLGCGKASPNTVAVPARHQFDSNGGSYSVVLETLPDPIQVNQLFDVRLTVTPKDPSVSSDLRVQVDARMPAHFHGMYRMAKVTHRGGASWTAEGLLFHMSGLWELYVDITRGGVTERAQMDVELK